MTDHPFLDFEKPIVELEKKISDMREFGLGHDIELSSEIVSMETKLDKLREKTFSNLTRWQMVQCPAIPSGPTPLITSNS